MKKCPFCAEEILDEAIKCKHCWSIIEEKEKNYLHFNYTFILEDWRKNFLNDLEQKYKLENVLINNRTWSETYWWWSRLFDKHKIEKIETMTFTKYDLSFKINSNNTKLKDLVDLYFKYHNLTYKNELWGFWIFIILLLSAFIFSLLSTIYSIYINNFNSISKVSTFIWFIIIFIILYIIFNKIIINSRIKSYKRSLSKIREKISSYKD